MTKKSSITVLWDHIDKSDSRACVAKFSRLQPHMGITPVVFLRVSVCSRVVYSCMKIVVDKKT